MFSASDLMEDISSHLLSQSTADTQAYGYAHKPLAADSAAQNLHGPGHFTYGLPNLDVATVVATPMPEPGRVPGVPIDLFRLNYRNLPSDEEMLDLANRSPSEHPERHYVRASTSSWDGQLVATVFVSAALEGHYLRVIMRPYELAPVVFELTAADELAKWNPFILAYLAVSVTIRQFVDAMARLNRRDIEPDTPGGAKSSRSAMRSTRERYARPHVNNIHQAEDSNRTISVIEDKIFQVVMNYLRGHNIDIDEYEQQVQSIIYNNTVNGDGNIAAGTFKNSQVANVSGQGNTTSNTSTTAASDKT